MFNRTLLASALFALFSQSALAADKVRWLNDWLPAGDKAAIYLGVEQACSPPKASKWKSPVPAVAATW